MENQQNNQELAHRRHHKFIHMGMVSMCSAMMSVFFGFLYMYATTTADLELKNIQVNALIDEVGNIQQDKTDLYQEILTDRSSLEDLGEKISAISGVDVTVDLSSIQSELSSQKTVVDALVKDQTDSVSTVSVDETFDILILGTHGSLTDTIMVASVNQELETVSLISIPRDLYVDGRKINECYNLYGIDQLEQSVYEITGIMPEKYVVVDLQAFIDIVDAIGGIDVNVEKSIYDSSYPNGKGGYMVFSLGAGQQHLDGSTALKYARSRHSSSDFDRASRQQQVISAVKDKLAGMDLSSQASDAISIFESVLGNLDTDIGLFDGIGYYSGFKDYTLETGNVLTTSNYLYSTYNTYGQYILLPNTGDYEEIKGWVGEIVKK
ncbi:MAG: LCP family protein [Candidatus Gracilibacteria bacterium]|jgi:LCP family protein required for cell wall assembly